MGAALLRALARVYEAGATTSAQYPFNVERQQQAEMYRAMALEADRQAELLEADET